MGHVLRIRAPQVPRAGCLVFDRTDRSGPRRLLRNKQGGRGPLNGSHSVGKCTASVFSEPGIDLDGPGYVPERPDREQGAKPAPVAGVPAEEVVGRQVVGKGY